jgi:hypothetical protein
VLTSTHEQWKDGRTVSTAVCAINTLRVRNPSVSQLLVEFSSNVPFNPIDLSQTVHAIAKGKLFSKIPPVFENKLEAADLFEFPSQSISLSVWSLAKLDQPNKVIFDNAARAVMLRNVRIDYYCVRVTFHSKRPIGVTFVFEVFFFSFSFFGKVNFSGPSSFIVRGRGMNLPRIISSSVKPI